MSASTNGSDSTKIGEANSNSTGGFALSLRETLRLKAQAKLQHEQQRSVAHSPITTTRASTSSSTVPKPDGDQDQHDDYEPLGSLNLGRGKRQVKRPTTYSIDPLDDASRLRSHPNKLPKSVAQLAADPFKTRKSINSMLREQQRRMSRGTDADGFSKAEAIARSMEEERLGKMGIAYDGQVAKEVSTEVSSRAAHKGLFSSSKVTQSSHGSKKDEPALSVRALSPTIPSYLWSSQSEAGETDDEQDTEEIQLHQSRLAKSFAAVNAAEDQKTVALDILQRDARHRIDPSSKRPMAHVPFYESERTTRPTVETFCDVVNISTKSDLTHSTSLAATSDDEAWLSHLPSMILCNMIPPYLDLNPLQISRLIIRIAVTYILNTDAVQSIHLSSFLKTLFHPSSASSHHFELCTTVPQALSQIISLIPRILNRIGVREHVLEECFPDEVEVTSWVCPTLKRPTTASGKPKKCQRVYLTQAEREHILTNLAQVLEMVTRADANKGERVVGSNVTTLAGYVASMAIASAASTNFTLEAQIGGALNAIFSAAARESCECLNDLQKERKQQRWFKFKDSWRG
uniref:Uncharacterized protein n=1 Tax=Melanopsichium pennsylvanicum 4 TaxID=1398559 RepID=A0A077R732_9BASI|nr:putative protein [Melanopsichium pennsylvanicum 4]